MFCSNCGKTVGANDTTCPHCHMALGDVRFQGIPYTSVQFRIVPGTPMPIDEAYSYTRTNYSVNLESGGDTPQPLENAANEEYPDGATTYRPTLKSDEEIVETADDETPAVDAVDPDSLSDERINKVLGELKEKGALDVDKLIQPAEFDDEPQEPEADPGLSERVEAYESDLRATQQRRQQKASKGFKLPFGRKQNVVDGVDDADEGYGDADPGYADPQEAPYDDGLGDQNEGEYSEPYQDEYGDYGEKRGFSLGGLLGGSVAGIRVSTILKILGGLILAVILLVLGLNWFNYVNSQQQKSPIDGVTLDLYTKGVESISTYASAENAAELLAAYNSEGGIAAMTEMVQTQTGELIGLLPAEPAVNDQLFVDALTSIESNIANAVTLDGISGDSTSAESTARWAVINQSVEALKSATDAVQLQAIVNGEKITVVVDEPTPSPTPVTYRTLTSGDSGQEVQNLQQRLYDLGYLQDAPDGKFGKKTTTAVKYFRMAHDLPVSGVADSPMQELLFSDEALDVQAGLAAYQARQAQEGNAEATAAP